MYSQINSQRGYYNGTAKIDSESIIEEYKNLRQQQKQFLNKINLSTRLKSQLFDLQQIRSSNKNTTIQRQSMVVVLDPFKGRLIMSQSDWMGLERQKQQQRRKLQQKIWQQQRSKEVSTQKEIVRETKKGKEKENKKQKKIKYQQGINSSFESKLQESEVRSFQGEKKEQKKFMNYFSRLFKKSNTQNNNNQSEQNFKKSTIQRKQAVIESQTKPHKQTPEKKNSKSKVEKKSISKVKSSSKGKKDNHLPGNLSKNTKTEGQLLPRTKSQLSIQSVGENLKSSQKLIKSKHKYSQLDKIKSTNRLGSKKNLRQGRKPIQQELQQSEQISSIHKKEIKQQENNASDVTSNKMESIIFEQILRQKNKK